MIIELIPFSYKNVDFSKYDGMQFAFWQNYFQDQCFFEKISRLQSIEESLNCLSPEEVDILTCIGDKLLDDALRYVFMYNFEKMLILSYPIIIAEVAHAWSVQCEFPSEFTKEVVSFLFNPSTCVQLMSGNGEDSIEIK